MHHQTLLAQGNPGCHCFNSLQLEMTGYPFSPMFTSRWLKNHEDWGFQGWLDGKELQSKSLSPVARLRGLDIRDPGSHQPMMSGGR